ncbi:hypothetical protein GCM10027031_01530 [Corynebacterium atrinae]
MGLSQTVSTEPAATLGLDPAAWRDEVIPPENATRPECQGRSFTEVPYSCLVIEGTSYFKQVTTTSATDKRSEINVDSALTMYMFDAPVAEIQDHVRINRSTAYPVPDPDSSMRLVIPDADVGYDSSAFTRQGLQFFFPFPAERKSYDYFERLTQESEPIDYVDELEHKGLKAYEFTHTITPRNLAPDMSQAFIPGSASGSTSTELTGRADRFYSPEQLQRCGHKPTDVVSVTSYFTVERTFWVQPDTGTILDYRELTHVFFAGSDEEARAFADDPSPTHTFFYSTMQWDEATTSAQTALAEQGLQRLTLLQAFAYLAKAVAFFLTVWGVVLILVRRRVEETP